MKTTIQDRSIHCCTTSATYWCVFALMLFTLNSYGQVKAGFQQTKDGAALIWNNYPSSEDQVSWSGGIDSNGYASGFGTLTWWKSSQWTSKYTGQMLKGRLNGHIKNEDADGSRFAGTYSMGSKQSDWRRIVSEDGDSHSPRPGTNGEGDSNITISLPAFLTKDYPYADKETARVEVLKEPTRLKVWGFQDLVAPSGSLAVTVTLFRSKIGLENKAQFLGTGYYQTGGPNYRRIEEELGRERYRDGSPTIIVAGFFTNQGSRIEELPMTIDFYGGAKGGGVNTSPYSVNLDKELKQDILRHSPPRVDPEDMRSVFRYAGMVSEIGFDGYGLFSSIRLGRFNNSWMEGESYFGKFDDGRLISRVELEAFGGPLALQAQKEARERNEILKPVMELIVVGTLAAVATGAVIAGGKTVDFGKKALADGARSLSDEMDRAKQANAYKCPKCDGYGKVDDVPIRSALAFGMKTTTWRECPQCDGTRWLRNGKPFKP